MATLINLSIDLNKIDKTKIQSTDKNGQPFKNGAKYYNVTIAVNDQTDNYGNNVACYESQSKDERTAGIKKNYIGNGKVAWTSDAKPVDAVPVVNKASERFPMNDGLHF